MTVELRRLCVSVQRGPCWLPTPASLRHHFAQLGELEEVTYEPGRGRGVLVFQDQQVADGLLHKSVDMAEQEGEVVSLFLWRDFRQLGPEAVAGLLLLESEWLPTGQALLRLMINNMHIAA
jgi:hypothetical protein